MGCNCGKKTQALSKEFVHTGTDNKKTVYRSEIEARAAVVRKGGTYEAK